MSSSLLVIKSIDVIVSIFITLIIIIFTSWLRDFLSYVESSRNYGDTSMQIATEPDFVSTLRDIYLSDQVGLVFSIQYSVFGIQFSVFSTSILDANHSMRHLSIRPGGLGISRLGILSLL